jgi:hypothetical protein
MKRKLAALVAACALSVGALAGFSTAAYATDDVGTPPLVITETTTETTTAISPTEPEPEVVLEEAPKPEAVPAPEVPSEPIVDESASVEIAEPVEPGEDADAAEPVETIEPPNPSDGADPSTVAPVTPAEEDARYSEPSDSASLEPFGTPVFPVAEPKVWVCKFVASDNSPGGFVLKSGKQPIEVSVNALDGDTATGPGATFSDAQPSFVVSGDDVALCQRVSTVVTSEIECPVDSSDGLVTTTTTTTTYYGDTSVDIAVEVETRSLTEAEIAECEDPPPPPEGDKVWVCKFVASENSPGGYVLKAGKQPIEVSVNALDSDTATGPGATFSDAQPSFVVPEDDASLCMRVVITVTEEIECPTDETKGQVLIETKTTTYYGSTVVDVDYEYSTRSLTEEELAECDIPTLDLVLPSAAFTLATCSSAGSYTLGAAEGFDPALVEWTVNGEAGIPSGTYPATTPSILTVVAVPVGDAGLEPEWSDPPPFSFVAATGCFAALASTGSTAPYGGVIAAGSLLLLGGAAALMRRRSAARDR